MQMNKEELKEWFKQSKYICLSSSEYDESGNYWSEAIYEHNGKPYSISFCNKETLEKWGEKGYIRGVYEPREVIRKTEMIERVYYELKESNSEKV
jgi:hypothetical protein